MKKQIKPGQMALLCATIIIGLLAWVPDQVQAATRIKVLVVTGGHGFDREPFFRMFAENPEITFTAAAHSGTNASAYERKDLLDHQVVVLYDMPRQISAVQKAAFMSLFDRGVGVVVLHHALVSYPNWPDYERIIGGRYLEPNPDKPGTVTEQAGYEHDVEVPVVIVAANHPVTAGLKDFTLHDEIYWGYRVGEDVTPLITTTHPRSGKPLGWTRNQGRSRVVFIQPGHGKEAFNHEQYRRLLAQAIRWVAPTPTQSSAADP